MSDGLITNAHLARFVGDGYGDMPEGAIAERDGRIAWLGREADLPEMFRSLAPVDGGGGWLTPGLIDCHTHLVYAGSRAGEFEARLNGESYESIARRGGGIRSTVRATRAASEQELIDAALPRLDALLAEGVTTIEIKSGYGLDLEPERRMLRAARRLAAIRPVRVVTTFLGAHAVPPEYEGRADDYIEHLCVSVLPELQAEGLVDAVDAFCESIAFSPDQVEKLFAAAGRLQLPVKLHAEQLSNQEGAALVARHQGMSADHLEWLSATGIEAMRKAGAVAVLLPGAFYVLRETRVPPIEALRVAGVPMAVATDSNPGTSPLTSLLLAANMASTLFRLTPQEALAGVTREAARALRLPDCGRLEVGACADLALWRVPQPANLVSELGARPLVRSWYAGRPRG
ncbi:MAG: imidazolonepropionase [Candidatus Eisenbacteria bacterium]|nr:imidazolonepropionase [Candidatus Eisenbacteria bacterium]